MNLVKHISRQHGIKFVSEDVFNYLAAATEAHLTGLLQGLVRIRLQRMDAMK